MAAEETKLGLSEVLMLEMEHGDAEEGVAEDGDSSGEPWLRRSFGMYSRTAPSQQAAASWSPLGEKARLVTRSKGMCSCIQHQRCEWWHTQIGF